MADFDLYFLAAQLQWTSRWFSGVGLTELDPSGTGFDQGMVLTKLLHPTLCTTGPGTLSTALTSWHQTPKRTVSFRTLVVGSLRAALMLLLSLLLSNVSVWLLAEPERDLWVGACEEVKDLVEIVASL
ncbi:hypothetical protein NDU88_007135 [Pleurodeles waltl]|uniref:Uncharacterized protein n=1 Tax=Pleurodeles waltl TaxID=8319 RepID=A0AAV7VSM5_PLEWA|nr:hypothetical protein NDU88_007135 [Pleurodeles waltl]